MKNKKFFAITLSFMLVPSVLLSSCSEPEPETLESLMNSDSEVLGEISKEAEKSGVILTVSGNEITYEYDISNQSEVDEDMLENEEYIEKYNVALDAGAGIFEDYVRQTEKTSEIEGISMVVRYTYKGKEIASRTFTSNPSGKSGSDDASSEDGDSSSKDKDKDTEEKSDEANESEA